MNDVKLGIPHRLLAAFMALVLVFGMIPVADLSVHAATMEYPDAVTISVTDAVGNPLVGAAVTYTIDSVTHGDAYITGTKDTDENGSVEVLEAEEFAANEFTVSAVVVLDGYEDGAVAKTAITAADQDVTIALTAVPTALPTIEDVSITAAPWTYDGKAHTMVSVIGQNGDVITYQKDNEEPSEEVPTAVDAGTYSVTVYVEREGYESLTKTVAVEVAKADIPVELTANTGLTYNGSELPLVELFGVTEDDRITWTVNGVKLDTEEIPVGTDAKTYTVGITVERNNPNFNVYTDTLEVEIAKANIEGVTLVANPDLAYNGSEQPLVQLSGVTENDEITWTVNGESTDSEDIPARMAIGSYTIVVTVDRGKNYNKLTLTVENKIGLGTINLDGLKVEGLNGVYTGEAQETVKVENRDGKYTLWYQLVTDFVNGEPQIKSDAWTTEIPTVTNVGSYMVVVKAVQANYNDGKVSVAPAAGAIAPYNVCIAPQKVEKPAADLSTFVYNGTEQTYVIAESALYTVTGNKQTNAGTYTVTVALKDNTSYVWADGSAEPLDYFVFTIDKAKQSLSFMDTQYTHQGSVNVTIFGEETFDFGVVKEAFEGNEVVYTLAEGTDADIAKIDSKGVLTVTDAGTVVIMASLTGNENYYDASIAFTLTVTEGVSDTKSLISFSHDDVLYVFGENEGIASVQMAEKYYLNDSDPSYSIDKTDIGLVIDAVTGEIKVENYALLGEALVQGGGSVDVTVLAAKEAKTGNGFILYEADSASYALTVSFMETPASPYVLSGTKGTINEVETGWYVSAVTAVPADAEKYTISKSYLPEAFDKNTGNAVDFSNQGNPARYVYLRSNATGGITAAIPVDIKIDTAISQPVVRYIPNPLGAVVEWLSFGFYQATVTVEIEFADADSGIDHFDYVYRVEDGASEINVGGSGVIEGDAIVEKDGKATSSFEIPAQFRGYVTVQATDKAGNSAETAGEKVVVVDTIAPGVTVTYPADDVRNGKYFASDRTFTIRIDEANFFAEDLEDGQLLITVNKELNDGTKTKEYLKPEFVKLEGDVYEAVLVFGGEADYTFDIQYTDRAGNVFDKFDEVEFVIDKTSPVINVEYVNNNAINNNRFDAPRTAKITVIEHNFDKTAFYANITVNGLAVVQDLSWTSEGDVHTTEIEFADDAHYTVALAATDLAGNPSGAVNYAEDSAAPTEFVVDQTSPEDLKITYEPDFISTMLGALTFGFYQAPVTVTIEATDPTAGIESFEYKYDLAENVSTVNEGGSGTISGADVKRDPATGRAWASFTVPAQFRGHISFTAKDFADNASSCSDENIVVVDDKEPVISVAYDNVNAQNGSYYDADRTATITITEANFFATEEWSFADLYDINPVTNEEYLVITVRKTLNDGTTTVTKERPEFEPVPGQADTYSANIKFDENADYIFDIKYTDRSGNVFDSYDADAFTIDKIAPEMMVDYMDTDVPEDDYYYQAGRTAIFTITEHNFRASDLNVSITATDITGEKVVDLSSKAYAAYLQNPNNWDRVGDVWTASVTLDIEGRYTIDMSYADMSGRDQVEAIHDEFCIDGTTPADLKISYAPDYVAQILENLTFGFYQAPVTVTIEATDEYAGVDYFVYSYAVAADASDINVGMADVTVISDDIKYEGNKASATFDIPAQFRGCVSFKAIDRAGNASEELVAKEQVVVDDIPPVVEVTYDNNDARYYDGHPYYGASRTATIKITEANFFEDDQRDGYLVITVEKTLNDGTYTKTIVQPEFTSEGDVHIATILFEEDADYTFDITYTDRSGNVYDEYEMDEFTVDNIAPVIDVTYDNNDAKNEDQFKADRKATIVVTEHNFCAADIAAVVMGGETNLGEYSEYLSNKDNWISEGDVYTVEIEYTEEAHYTFAISYTDMAGHTNEGVNFHDSVAPEKFTLDKTAPDEHTITIDGKSVLDLDNSVIFDTFYDKQIKVELGANFDISGMESIKYQKVNAVSEYNVDGEWLDYDAENGIVVAPNEKIVIFFRAEDRAGNVSIVHSTGIVVDDQQPIGETNAPEIDIIPAEPNENGIHNGDVIVNLKVIDPKYAGGFANEAGFYSGLNNITYRIYTTDTDEVEEGVLLDLVKVTGGAVFDGDNLVSGWSGAITIDSTKFNSNNVVVEVSATDNAGNIRTSMTTAGDIKIDITAPQIDVSYNNNNPDSGSYYNDDRVATITITERNFNAENVVVTIANSDGTIPSVPVELADWTEVIGTGNQDDTTFTATIVYSADGDYEFAIECTDLAAWTCGNIADKTFDNSVKFAANTANPTAFTIDQTNPVIQVSYNNNAVLNGNYFKATRTATVTITEHNFDVSRVIFTHTAGRGGITPNVVWSNNGNIHVATLHYAADGDYTFDVTMTDMAGNSSGGANYGNSVAAKDFIIDTTFESMITIGGVETGKAYGYSDDVIPSVSISDINLKDHTVTLTGVQKDITIDLTDEANALLSVGGENVSGSLNIFDVIQSNDGIYTLTVTSEDMAGNTDKEEVIFTVNRFGSVYFYEDYLAGLISNGGAYVLNATDDLVIIEYNADKLVADSLVIEITRDGKPLENVIFEVTPEINDTVAVGESGWYQYRYTISKDNFASDGVYKVSISSMDATGNTPENGRYEDMGILFRVDSTQAQISSIIGLEEAIINAPEQTVKYTVYDTMGLKSVTVYVDGKVEAEINDFGADLNNHSGEFTLSEQSAAQRIRIVVEDLAGNITDTDAEDFSSAYAFNKSVTVSTKIFVRWYANKPLFWGSIGGTAVVAGGLWFFLAAKRKKKEENTSK